MNPCPCGHLGHPVRSCACSPVLINRYLARISAPLLDRIDIHLRVPALPFSDLVGGAESEPSGAVRERVEAARAKQRERFGERAGVRANGHLSSREVRRHCPQTPEIAALLRTAVERLGLSARGCYRVLKVARTVADLAGGGPVAGAHVREALQYRSLDRSPASV